MARKRVGAQSLLRQLKNTPEFCEIPHKNNLRHAQAGMENVGGLVYNGGISKGKINEKQKRYSK